jgi:YHS domain-containing protein
MSYARLYCGVCTAAVLAMVAGCSSQGGADKPAAPAEQQKAVDSAPGGDAASIAKAMAELSPEERAAAEKQRVCPVSGEPLGSMGKPYKITVKGQTVFLCCSGCEEEIRKEPDKYLAKLKSPEAK